MVVVELGSYYHLPNWLYQLLRIRMETISPPSSRRIAVIGAGPSGLVAFRELRREKHTVVVYERSKSIGGLWVYSPEIETDPLGTDPNRKVISSSLYESLRVNLPRECMGFFDYPFVGFSGGDERRFPRHNEVLDYLERFAKDIGVVECLRFGTEVVGVERGCDGKWMVRSTCVAGGETVEIYDGVVVCSGHCTEPIIANIPGIDDWPGKQIHSHNYRRPDPFIDQIVVLIGNSHSSWDISRDISGLAKEVHISIRSQDCLDYPRKLDGYDNIWNHTMVKRAYKDGTIVFEDGNKVMANAIVHCTGYKYHFPFIKTEDDIITVDDNRVAPLYKHVFPPSMAPGLSFIGIPLNTQISVFPMCELQCKWVAAILSERINLPPKEEMLGEVKAYIDKLDHFSIPKKYTHCLLYQKYDMEEYEYVDWLAMKSGCQAPEEWRKKMFMEVQKNRAKRPNNFRDVWDDESLVEQAQEDFKRLLCL